MAIKSNLEKSDENEVFSIEFTAGNIQQLRDLATYLQEDDFEMGTEDKDRMEMVVRIGIAWLERLKLSKAEKENSSTQN